MLLHDENDGPRGRIDLIRTMLEAGGAPAPKIVAHLDRCLSCMSCMTTCAIRVDYLHLIDSARVYIEQHHRRPAAERFVRALIARTVPHPRRFRAALAAARLARPFGALLPRALRTRIAPLLELARTSAPRGRDLRPGIHPAHGARRARVGLLAGCAQRVLTPEINCASVRLLTRAGCEVVVAESAGCCGSLALHMGREGEALASARRNVDAWSAELADEGLDAILVNASGCGSTMKDYAHLFRRDPAYRSKAERVGRATRDISEFLATLDLGEPAQPRRYALAYHDACSLRNVQRVTEAPRALLKRAGYVVRDVPEAHFCCGSAGSYNMLQPQLADELARRKASHIESTGAALVAAGNVGCIVQLSRYLSLPVLHTVELLDWAYGGPAPGQLAGPRAQRSARRGQGRRMAATGQRHRRRQR